MKQTFTLKQFLSSDFDIDVYDDYDERLGIAFCGPTFLTEQGEQEFGHLMDKTIEVHFIPNYADYAVVHCDTGREASQFKKLFDSLAGLCSEEDWDRWFKY